MKLYIDDVNTENLVADLSFPQPIPQVIFKRGDKTPIEAVFAGDVTGRIVTFGIKVKNDFDGDYLVTDTATGLSGNSVFLNPSFNTTSLSAALSADTASITGMLEFTWSDDSGISWVSTKNVVDAFINNDVNKGIEGSPLQLPTPEEWFIDAIANITTPLNSNSTVSFSSNYVSFYDGGSIQFLQGASSIDFWNEGGSLNFYEDNSGIVGNGNDNYIVLQGLSGSYIQITGEDSYIETTGANSPIRTTGAGSHIETTGGGNIRAIGGSIYTDGGFIYTQAPDTGFLSIADNSPIQTNGVGSSIFSTNADAHIYTTDSTSWIGVATGFTLTAPLDVNADTIRIRSTKTPASSGATGNQGEICYDTDYLYIAVANNTWKRVALNSW